MLKDYSKFYPYNVTMIHLLTANSENKPHYPINNTFRLYATSLIISLLLFLPLFPFWLFLHSEQESKYE